MLENKLKINEIACAIKYDMADEELLRYNPCEFQERVSIYMENLKIFVNQYPDEVMDTVFEMAVAIEAKQDEGYLWIDHYDYRGEEYFDFDIFSDEIMALINNIEDKEIQLRLFIGFGALANESNYLSFSYENLEIEDKREVLQYFDNDSPLNFYYFIKELLSFEEKESFLLAQDLKRVYKKLIYIYLENDKKELAIKIVEDLLKERFDVEYVEQLVKLSDISDERFRGFVRKAIEERSYGSFDFIADGLKRVDNQKELEALWKKRDLYAYYTYLEREKRIDEIFELLKKLPEKKESFLKQNKEAYPKEAMEFFNAQIEENLRTTGDNYYRAIADALFQLKSLIDEDEFHLRVERLKSEYKRRRNFVAILVNRFG